MLFNWVWFGAERVGDPHFEDSWLLTMPKGGKAGGGKGGGKGASGGASKSGGGGKSKGKGDSTLESQVYSAIDTKRELVSLV